jgi:hypothetical protein
MKAIERKDLVVGVEYILDNHPGREKAHYVGRNDEEDTLFFISSGPSKYFTNKEGFITFRTTGDPFFL